MKLSDQELLRQLGRMPLVDTAELVIIVGATYVAIHLELRSMLGDGIAGRVGHGTANLPSSRGLPGGPRHP